MYSVFASDYGGGAVNVQNSSTENKPALGERERESGRGEGGGGRERAFATGDRRERVSVSMEYKLRISLRTACSDRGGSDLQEMDISCAWKRALQSFGKGAMTVQRCEISDESTRHVFAHGRTHQRVLSPGCDRSVRGCPCRHLRLNALRILNRVFLFLGGRGLLWGCVIRG